VSPPEHRIVDVSALREPVGRWDGQYLAEQVAGRPAYGHWRLSRAPLWWCLAGMLVLVGAWAGLLAVFVSAADPWTPGMIILFAAGCALVLVLYLSLAVSAAGALRAGQRVRALARVIRFANRNGLVYEPIAPNRDFAGERFAGLYLRDRVADPTGTFEYGQRLQPGVHGAHSGSPLGWYVAVRLERAVPSTVATPVRGGGFALAGAKGADADLVFTSELRAALGDRGRLGLAETADRWLVVHPPGSLSLESYGSEDFHRRMLGLLAAAASSPLVNAEPLVVQPAPTARVRRPHPRLAAAALLVALALPLIAATAPFATGVVAQIGRVLP
jgi:hypothetical protein